MSTLPDAGPPPAKGVMATNSIETLPYSEESPLLGQIQKTAKTSQSHPRANYVFFALLSCMTALQFGSTLVLVPNLEIYRYIICQKHYKDSSDLDLIELISKFSSTVDARCAIPEISKQVANFNGLVLALESICAIIVVLPLGRLMDVRGRKLPLYISLVGALLSMIWSLVVLGKAGVWSINTLLVPPIIVGLCGSSPMIRTIMRAIICDCYTDAARLVAVSWISATLLMCNSVAPAVGSGLLTHGLLWPLYGGLICFVLGISIACIMPETHPVLVQPGTAQLDSGPSQLTNDEHMHALLDRPKTDFLISLLQTVKNSFSSLSILVRGVNFMVLAFIAFVAMSVSMVILVIAQFLSLRLGWSMAASGYYISVHNGIKIVALLLILPLFTKIMVRRVSSQQLDLLLLRAALIGDALAAFGYGILSTPALLPPILVVQSFGSPLTASLTSLVSKLVGPDELGQLFAAISVVEGLGEAVGNPAMAAIYSATLTHWPGTVFLVIGAAFLLAFCASLLIDLRKLPEQVEEE